MKIGEIVKKYLVPLLISGKIPPAEIINLTSEKYCKESFNLYLPMLKKSEGKTEYRYYSPNTTTLHIYGIDYLLTNDWYDDYQRHQLQPLVMWMNKYDSALSVAKFDEENCHVAEKSVSRSSSSHVSSTRKSDWPKWEQPSDDDCFALAQMTTKYIRFLSPDIIKAVVEDNEKIKQIIWKFLESKNINPELYLWEKSSCCFPGVRRYAGSSEISAYRARSEIADIEDAVKLDDNDYPKQLWSFIFRGAQFGKFGPDGYSLAHLVDHKKDKNRMSEEFDFANGHKFDKPFYGLYTCASNSVYIPNNLMKPTDFNGPIRNLLFRKAESLYGVCCNLVPPYAKPKNIYDNDKWNIENFEWAEPVGSLDNIQAFLEFRQERLKKIFNAK